jgi:hypothetical protein
MSADQISNPIVFTDAVTISGPLSLPASCVPTAAIVDANVTAGKLTVTMQKGIIPLDLASARIITANDIDTKANVGGLLCKDSAPILERVNAATDKCLRIKWAAANVAEVQFGPIAYPPDLDNTLALTLKFRAKMGGGTDNPVLTAAYFEGVGGTNKGGNTAALNNTEQTLSVSIAGVSAPPQHANVSVLPGTHGTDTVELHAAWIEYFKK